MCRSGYILQTGSLSETIETTAENYKLPFDVTNQRLALVFFLRKHTGKFVTSRLYGKL